jgi:di/tricarboxylate transporter
MDAAIVLGIVALALVLFWTEWVSIEVTSILVVFLLAVTGVLEPEEAFGGFSNPTVIFIFALLAMTQGLAASGVIRAVGGRLAFMGRYGARVYLLATMAVVAAFSAFVSNTVTAAAFLPLVLSGAARVGVPAREVLMPMAFASMLGGTILLFGTSTNLVMSEVISRAGFPPLSVAELAPAGIPITIVGIALIALFGPWLLRVRGAAGAEPETVPRREYLAEVTVPPGSPHVGRPLAEVGQALGAKPLGVVRPEGAPPSPDGVLEAEDRVVVEGRPEEIVEAADARGVELPPAAVRPARDEGSDTGLVVVEAAVPPGSRLAGRTMEEARLAERLGVELLALHRRPTVQRITKLQLFGGTRRGRSIAALPISVGDVLLLRAPLARVQELAATGALLVLSGVEHAPQRRGRAVLAALIFAGALVLGTAGVFPMAVAGLGGVVAMVLTGCVDGRRILRVDWRVVLLIGSMLALGLAMERSGAGELIGELVARFAGGGGPRVVLVVLALLTILLSAPMSNQAAALVVFPIALSTAAQLGLDPRALAVGVTLAGSCSFMTPLEPAAMLVYGAGRYRFADFVRVGTPLTLAVIALIAILVPIIWPLGG